MDPCKMDCQREAVSGLPLLQARRGVCQHAPAWYEDELLMDVVKC